MYDDIRKAHWCADMNKINKLRDALKRVEPGKVNGTM